MSLADMSNEEIVTLVNAYDTLSLPMERRFEGDDDELENIMEKYGFKRDVVTKSLIIGQAMRFALHKGLHIPSKN